MDHPWQRSKTYSFSPLWILWFRSVNGKTPKSANWNIKLDQKYQFGPGIYSETNKVWNVGNYHWYFVQKLDSRKKKSEKIALLWNISDIAILIVLEKWLFFEENHENFSFKDLTIHMLGGTLFNLLLLLVALCRRATRTQVKKFTLNTRADSHIKFKMHKCMYLITL